MRLELINIRSTILPLCQFALHHHMFRERDSNHASPDPKSIVLPLDDPGMEPAVAEAMAGKVGEGRIEHPRHLSTAFTVRQLADPLTDYSPKYLFVFVKAMANEVHLR